MRLRRNGHGVGRTAYRDGPGNGGRCDTRVLWWRARWIGVFAVLAAAAAIAAPVRAAEAVLPLRSSPDASLLLASSAGGVAILAAVLGRFLRRAVREGSSGKRSIELRAEPHLHLDRAVSAFGMPADNPRRLAAVPVIDQGSTLWSAAQDSPGEGRNLDG